MKRRVSAAVVGTTVAVAACLGLLNTTSAQAQSDPVFGIKDAPSGVYFRNSPNSADTDAVYGLGAFPGEQLRLLCSATGEPEPTYGNAVWYQATNVSRPVNFDGSTNSGMINAHYVDDGLPANVADPGVPACSSQPSAPTQVTGSDRDASFFFSPIGDGHASPYSADDGKTFFDGPATADFDVPLSGWAGDCGARFDPSIVPDSVSTLAGWSRGRLGPIYFLAHAPAARVAGIHTIVLFDPGSSSDFEGNCDARYDINGLLSAWLRSDSGNQLLILTGRETEEKRFHGLGESTFSGLWQHYLAGIWNQPFASKATICDYDGLSHYNVFAQFRGVVRYPSSGCPVSPNAAPPVQWHP